MGPTGILAVLLATLALGACGTHDNPNPYGAGPVYYRTAAASQTRPPSAETAPARSRQTAYRNDADAAILQPASMTPIEPALLQPVSTMVLASAGEAQATSAPAAPPASDRVVTVQAGDTVYALGRRYQTSPQAIIAENNLRAPYHLEVGQRIRLPAGADKAETAETAAPLRGIVARDTLYEVRNGDTLLSVARTHGVEHKTIAQANNLVAPYPLAPGQQLLIPQARVDGSAAPRTAAAPAPAQPLEASRQEPKNVGELAQAVSYTPPPAPAAQPPASRLFDWPVKGAIIAKFGAGELGRRNDGVNIAAPMGTPVRAAADGEVVYRGSELDGFGNLLLVKHTDGYVTAYAHNDSMLVQKGQQVRQGQVIAKVGQTGSVSAPQLHFEIRQDLKSVDPAVLLGPQ